jgi:MFS family permease
MRSAATFAVMLVTFLVAMEGTVISTAMPHIVRDLGGRDYYSLAFSAYLSCVTITGLLWGRLSDRWGVRSAYVSSVVLFLLGSLTCAQAFTMPALVAGRALQGLGGGGLTPLGQTALGLLYSKQERARVQGLLVSVFGISSILGPAIGGWIVSEANWRWIFYLNFPFAGLGLVLVLWSFPPPQPATAKPFDWLGLACFSIWQACLLGACSGHLWAIPITVALGLILVWHQFRQSHPFLPLELLSQDYLRRLFPLLVNLGMTVFAAANYLPLYYQELLGQSSAQAGRSLLPLMLAWVFSAAVAPSWSLRVGSRRIVGLGSFAVWLGFGLLAWCPPGVWPGALGGIGIGMGGGLTFSPVVIAVQSAVAPGLLGTATASLTFLRSLGATLGTALLGLWLQPLQCFSPGWALASLGLWLWWRTPEPQSDPTL